MTLTLYPYQQEGARFLAARRRAVLADAMGVGKTAQAIAALDLLGPSTPAVVVCPAVVKFNWKNEFARFSPHRHVTVLQGRSSFRPPEAGEVVVINYDVLPPVPPPPPRPRPKRGLAVGGVTDDLFSADIDALAANLFGTALPKKLPAPKVVGEPAPWTPPPEPPPLGLRKGTTLVVDEAHTVKNKKTAVWRAVRRLSRECVQSTGSSWFLTGTPLLNRHRELWDLLEAGNMASDVFGGFGRFLYLFGLNTPQGVAYYDERRRTWVFGDPRPEVPKLLARSMLRRTKEEVLEDLPPKVYQTHLVSLDDVEDQDAFSSAVEAFKAELDSVPHLEGDEEDVAFETFDPEVSEARKGPAHFVVRRVLAEEKVIPTLELVESLEAAGEPVVLFSCHLAPVEFFGKREGWACVHGGVSAAVRQSVVDRFQRGELRGVALTVGAGGVGITLTAASHVVFVDLAWTPALNEQAEDRCHRRGQTRAVTVHRVVLDHPVERRVVELNDKKRKLISDVILPTSQVEGRSER